MSKVQGIGPKSSGKLGRRARRWICLALALSQGVGIVGCTRRFFRDRADTEVSAVLAEKDKFPQWGIEQFHVYPDSRARFADPTNPDRPPMPPDDPAAYDLSPNPQKPGKAGVGFVGGTGYLELLAHWDAENRATQPTDSVSSQASPFLATADSPPQSKIEEYVSTLLKPESETDCRRPYLITLDQALQLGLFNSREFQDRREDLYLAALPVTLQRFAFAAQFLAAEQTVRQWSGRETPDGKTNQWQLNGVTGFTKLFSTGALLLFRIANQTVVEMAGDGGTTSFTNLSLDLFQPLLRGGGRAVTLEPLTQVERNLLYLIRSYARFRKEFYVSIAGGSGGSISGGVFVPTGVIAPNTFSPTAGFGSSGVVPGLVAVGLLDSGVLPVTPGASGRLNLSAAIPAPVAGYLGTLLEYTQIDLDRANISNLQVFLRLFEALKEGGDVSQLQVDQVEQQLLRGRSTLLADEQQFLDSLDRFKLQLGLPTDVPLRLDDSPLRPLLKQFRSFETVFKEFDSVSKQAAAFNEENRAAQVRDELRNLFTTSLLVRDTRFAAEILTRWEVWTKLSPDEFKQRFDRLAEERRRLLDRQADLEQAGKDLDAADQRRLTELDADLELSSFERALRDYEAEPWKAIDDPARRRQSQLLAYRFVVNSFTLVLGAARSERLEKVTNQWPQLPPLCVENIDLLKIDPDEAQAVAGRAALDNRFDLMNVRAQLVDGWRQLAVFANALLGTVNVGYQFDSFSPLGEARPLALGGSRNRHQLVLNTEMPLIRKPERNNYRASLIAFQRQRRALMEAEDLVLQGVRGETRQLRVLAENYKIQQRQVELAYQTVESSLDAFQAPPAPAGLAGSQDAGVRAASLTQQLLNAQNSLLQAQNQLLTVWVTYTTTRMQLYRDLEIMPLDNRGVWNDEHTACNPEGRTDGVPCAEPAPLQWHSQPAAGTQPAAADAQPTALPSPNPIWYERGR